MGHFTSVLSSTSLFAQNIASLFSLKTSVAIRELAEQIKLLVAKGEIPLDHPTKVKELKDKLCALTTDLRKQQQQLISARDRDSEGVKGGRREVGLVK